MSESARAVRHRAEMFASLQHLEPFQELGREVDRRQRRVMEDLLQQLMNGASLEELDAQITFQRGFFAGMRYLTRAIPAGAESTLRKLNDRTSESDEPEEDYWSYEQPED